MGWCAEGVISFWEVQSYKSYSKWQAIIDDASPLPDTSSASTKYFAIYYQKSLGDSKLFIPTLIEIPKDYNVAPGVKPRTIPVWDKASKKFTRVAFDCKSQELPNAPESNENDRHAEKSGQKNNSASPESFGG